MLTVSFAFVFRAIVAAPAAARARRRLADFSCALRIDHADNVFPFLMARSDSKSHSPSPERGVATVAPGPESKMQATPTDRRTRAALAIATTFGALVLAACGSSDSTATTPDYEAAVAKAPPALADLYADGDAVLDGGEEAYEAAIDGVEGHPVVVNNWASWCIPCRDEFPYFQSQAAKHLDEVAFLGVDSEDSKAAAETFLEDNPLPYPSIEAPDKGDLGDWAGTTLVGYPNTLYYDRDGELVYTHQGPYTSEDDLAADIDKYAFGED